MEGDNKTEAVASGPPALRPRALRIQLRQRGRGRTSGARLPPRAASVPLSIR